MTPTPTKQIKKVKKCLTVRQKLAVIEDVEVNKKSYSTVAEIHGISKSSVGDIIKKKSEYLEYKEQGRNLAYKKICMNPFAEELDKRVWNWFCAARGRNIAITGENLKLIALQVAKKTCVEWMGMLRQLSRRSILAWLFVGSRILGYLK